MGSGKQVVVGGPVGFDFRGWRTGIFLGVVENTRSSKARNFGLYRIKPNFVNHSEEVLVRPEAVTVLDVPEGGTV